MIPLEMWKIVYFMDSLDTLRIVPAWRIAEIESMDHYVTVKIFRRIGGDDTMDYSVSKEEANQLAIRLSKIAGGFLPTDLDEDNDEDLDDE